VSRGVQVCACVCVCVTVRLDVHKASFIPFDGTTAFFNVKFSLGDDDGDPHYQVRVDDACVRVLLIECASEWYLRYVVKAIR
jgi:hypothetical protein